MEILRGAPALSEFRVKKLLQGFAEKGLKITSVYAEYVHFASLSSPLSDSEKEILGKILTYGPRITEKELQGTL